MITNLLFIYGTLLNPDNEFAAYLQKNSDLHCKGTFKGKLYDIGEYPGAVEDRNGKSYVHGSILILNNLKALKVIDHYEGFGASEPQPNLFIRKLINAETTIGIVKCWVYLYNLPVDGLHLISSGDYFNYTKK
ncbi:MAG TPA: gamma-glutamylcyclotransferase family protein [Mucilaginibacter sp.]